MIELFEYLFMFSVRYIGIIVVNMDLCLIIFGSDGNVDLIVLVFVFDCVGNEVVDYFL